MTIELTQAQLASAASTEVIIEIEQALFEPLGMRAVVVSRAVVEGVNLPRISRLGITAGEQDKQRDQAGDPGQLP